MKVLDLFCGGGGASYGYYLAIAHLKGWSITGVDIKPQKRYPFKFVLGDALDYLAKHGHEYDFIHASPPCQKWSDTQSIRGNHHPDLLTPTREILQSLGKPYVIENVEGAPLIDPLMLCGTMFGLRTIRHRLFECNPPVYFAPASCCHNRKTAPMGRKPDRATEFISVVGNFSDVEYGRVAMGIAWMTGKELSQSFPPVYTEYIGSQLLKAV